MMFKAFAILVFMFLGCAEHAPAGPAVIFNGPFVKTLKDDLKLKDTAFILTSTSDPTAVATSAPEGSLLLRNNAGGNGQVYWKLDDGLSTNWSLITVSLPSDLVDDTTPQLGGFLDINGQNFQEGATLLFHLTGTSNLFFGEDAGGVSITGSGANTCIGTNACMGIGNGAGTDDGSRNTVIGAQAGDVIDGGDRLLIIGASAGGALVNSTNVIAIGDRTFEVMTGSDNVGIGTAVGDLLVGGIQNTYVGNEVAAVQTAGNSNTAMGRRALFACTTCGNNSILGNGAGDVITGGINNTLMGLDAGNTITIGDNNTLIGIGSDVTFNNAQNRCAFGNGAISDTDNLCRFGNDSVTVYEYAPGSTIQPGSGDLTLSSALLGLSNKTADPCSGQADGTLFYNSTANYVCFCEGSADFQVHSPATVCFP